MTDTTLAVTYEEIHQAALELALRWKPDVGTGAIVNIFGVPRGGCVPAALVAGELRLPLTEDYHYDRTLIVDDLTDSGNTLLKFAAVGYRVDALFRKSWSLTDIAPLAIHLTDDWLTFPWEVDASLDGPEVNVTRLLQAIGEDPTRPGLADTPSRVVKAMREMTSGRDVDVAALLGRVFDDTCDEMVVVRNIEFTSLCEHHLLPFTGTAAVAYIPTDKVVGLSKLARLVDAFAQRLQVQERMTQEIAGAITEHLAPKGVGVIVAARHSCMGCRGVKKPSAEMVTSALSGLIKDDPKARGEFLAFVHAP